MKEVGTLQELDVKPGDVVESMKSNVRYTITKDMQVGNVMVKYSTDPYELISRANTPKLWRDMTDAEKGALLLAKHEGKVIEFWMRGSGGWMSLPEVFHANEAYRVRPEPKIEVVTVYGSCRVPTVWGGYRFSDATHRITFTTIDGKPDTASIKMEAI